MGTWINGCFSKTVRRSCRSTPAQIDCDARNTHCLA